jgi:hypothetical protein
VVQGQPEGLIAQRRAKRDLDHDLARLHDRAPEGWPPFAARAFAHTRCGALLCVPKTSSTSCDQAIFVDQASDVSLFPDAVVVEIDWLG